VGEVTASQTTQQIKLKEKEEKGATADEKTQQVRQHCSRTNYTGKATAGDYTLKAMLQSSNYTGKATAGDYTEDDATAGQTIQKKLKQVTTQEAMLRQASLPQEKLQQVTTHRGFATAGDYTQGLCYSR
jgi:hypothetical protein